MYITDKKIKQCICSYIRHKYGVDVNPQRIYVFKNEYNWGDFRCEYTISKYKGYNIEQIPEIIPSKEIDQWGMILSRKEKIEKIQKNGNKQGHRGMVRY